MTSDRHHVCFTCAFCGVNTDTLPPAEPIHHDASRERHFYTMERHVAETHGLPFAELDELDEAKGSRTALLGPGVLAFYTPRGQHWTTRSYVIDAPSTATPPA